MGSHGGGKEVGKWDIGIVENCLLESLVRDIKDAALDLERLPFVAEVVDWAEIFYSIRISPREALGLIEKGRRIVGWTN